MLLQVLQAELERGEIPHAPSSSVTLPYGGRILPGNLREIKAQNKKGKAQKAQDKGKRTKRAGGRENAARRKKGRSKFLGNIKRWRTREAEKLITVHAGK